MPRHSKTSLDILKAQFEPAKEAIEKDEFGITDLFDIISPACVHMPVVGIAMVRHVHDILSEFYAKKDKEEIGGGEVIAEMYWRTFFDPETADKYGTTKFAEDPSTRANIVESIVMKIGSHLGHDLHSQPDNFQ